MFFLDPLRIAKQRSRHAVLRIDSFCPSLCSRAGESCGISARQRHSQEQCGGSGSRNGLGSLLFDELWSYSGHRQLEQGCICISSCWDVTNDSTGALPLLIGLSHGYLIPWGAGSGTHNFAGITLWKGWSAWISGWKGWGRAGPQDACPWRPARAGWGSPEEELSGNSSFCLAASV